MNQPLVSVLIPSYNHSKYITFALDSVVNDDYPNKEIIVLDDGSKDDTVKIIEAWASNNTKLSKETFRLIARENRGLLKTLNQLIDEAKGEYIVFLASDDALANNSIGWRVNLLQQTGKLVAIGDSIVIDDNNTVTHQSFMKDVMHANVEGYKTEEGLMEELLLRFALSGPCLLVKKELFNIIGKYPEDLYAEDYWFYQQCAAQRFIVFKDEIVSLYRRHEDNTSGKPGPRRRKILRSIIKTYFKNWHLFPGLRLKFLALKRGVKWTIVYMRRK
jgi:alpha-1,3-rhamnosyltransferase